MEQDRHRDEKVPLLGRKGVGDAFTEDIMHSSKGSYQVDMNSNPTQVKAQREHRRKLSMSMTDVLEAVTLTWQNISVHAPLPTKSWRPCASGTSTELKQILFNVSGVVEPGTLLAILGASGAGKTTLLNVLTYRNRGNLIVDGDVRANGGRIGKGMPSMSAYIQQEDLFIGTLTVREHLWFQSMLRMDKDITTDVRKRRVEQVTRELSLTKCQDGMIGIPGKLKGISGGEKKRLAFASEVLTNPPLMFCDEPTSGLDSFMARSIVTTMKSMASKGRTVICTIHQPSSEVFALFDRVLLVAEGRVAYMGPASKALSFFETCGHPCPVNFNPADHYVLTLAVVPGDEEKCKKRINNICNTYEASDFGEKVRQTTKEALFHEEGLLYDEEAFPDKSPYRAPWLRQFWCVLWRSWLGVQREPGVFKTRVLQAFILSLLFGLVYFGQEMTQEGVTNINGALFLMINQMTFGFVFAVIHAFPPEFPIFLREHHDGMYRVDVYFLAKTLAETPQFVIIPIIFTAIMYWLVGLYANAAAFLICVVVLFLVCNVAVSLGYCLSSCSSDPSFVLALGPIFVVPIMMIGGFFINTGTIPAWFLWLKYLSWFTYANEILVVNQWSEVTNITCHLDEYINGTLAAKGDVTCYKNGNDVINSMAFTSGSSKMAFDFGMLLILLVGFRVVAFLFLYARSLRRYKINSQKRTTTPAQPQALGIGTQC